MKKKEPKQEKEILMFTYTGKSINLNDLKPEDIDPRDIAHALSNLCRYNGHTTRFYSVAEHCVRLARYAFNNYTADDGYNIRLARALLIHDATEAYVGDVIYHLKQQLPQFCKFEDKVGKRINDKFSIDMSKDVQGEVSSLDRRICFDEMYALYGRIDPWFYENKVVPLGMDKIYLDATDRMGWTPEQAEAKYIGMAAFLGLTVQQPTSTED